MDHPGEIVARLLYVSRMTTECTPSELKGILDISRKNNREMDVTGALCYSAGGFLQCLEGPASAVNEIYRRIVRDRRNKQVTLLSYSPIEKRGFEDWTMAFMRSDDMDHALLARHGISAPFDPFRVPATQALELLEDMVRERTAFLREQARRNTDAQ